MQQLYAFGAGVIALLFTVAYLYFPERRVPVSGTIAFLLWGMLALQGGDIRRLEQSGTKYAAPIPDELRFVLAALAIISLLAVVLYTLGVYPPEREGESDADERRYRWNSGD